MVEIARYISQTLNNPAAARRLSAQLAEAEGRTVQFPYASPVYHPLKPLKHEYRKQFVQNYIMLYRVDEDQKLVTVVRVIYARRNYEKLLE